MKVVYACENCDYNETRDFFLTELDMSTGRIGRPCGECGGPIRRHHVMVNDVNGADSGDEI